MAISQMNLENGKIFGLKYGGYEDPKTFEPFHLLLLGLDFIFNWFIDWATDPLAILVIFVFQCLGLIVNLIVYIMASGSQAMQSGLKKSLIYHHEIHLITSLLYTTLTCSWYVWALRKSWPSLSDQFSFSFGSDEIFTTIATPITHIPLNVTTTTPTPTSTTALTTLAPLLSNLTNNGSILSNNTSKLIRSSFAHIKNFFPTKVSRGSGSAIVSGANSTKEFYTLWSSGFVALYTIQRTVAIIYYFVSLKATFLVLNASTIDSLEENRGKKRITKSPGNVGGGVRRISSTYPDTTDITIGMREGNKGDEFPVENWGRRGRNLRFGNNQNPPLMAQANKKVRMAASVSDVLRNNRKGNVPEM